MESQIPPPPENHVMAQLRQNDLPSSARALLDMSWRGVEAHPSLLNPDVTSSEILDDEHYTDDFWENGALRPLPSFEQTIEDVKSHPERYTRLTFSDLEAFAAPLNGNFNHSITTNYYLQESDALIELDSYLDHVMEVSSTDDDAEDIYVSAKSMRESLGYLSESKFEESTLVLATLWAEYLKDNPGSQINVYKRPYGKHKKSFEYVLEAVKEKLVDIDLDAAMRVVDHPDAWKDSEGSLLVVLDDWVISGKSAIKMVDEATKTAKDQHLDFTNRTEVHTLAREAEASLVPGVSYRSIYLHSTEGGFKATSMAGSHSSANYGFEHPLRDMQKYLQSKGIFMSAPVMQATEPVVYRDQSIMRAIDIDVDDNLLEQIAVENEAMLSALHEMFQLRRQARSSAVNNPVQELSVIVEPEASSMLNNDEVKGSVDKLFRLEIFIDNLKNKRRELRKKLNFKIDRI